MQLGNRHFYREEHMELSMFGVCTTWYTTIIYSGNHIFLKKQSLYKHDLFTLEIGKALREMYI